MGNYQFQKKREERIKVHPFWRGAGCFLVILVPVFSYALADYLVIYIQENGVAALPSTLLDWVNVPFLGPIAHLWGNLLFTIGLVFIIYSLLTILYSIMYRSVGPSLLGSYDVKPIRKHKKSRRR